MRVANILKATLAAVVLVGSTALPAAAHGDVRRIIIWYDDFGGESGRYILYCDGHTNLVGSPWVNEEIQFYDCPN